MLAVEGERYGKLTIIGQAEPAKNGAWRVLARCDCGLQWRVGYHDLWRSKERPNKGCRSCRGQVMPKVGDRFGERVIIEELGLVDGLRRYVAKCDCGTVSTMQASELKRGNACSACHGGYKQGRLSLRFPAEYTAWKGIRRRCRPDTRWAKGYHERGITMCPEWADDFGAFLRDVGPRPGEGYTVERVDNNQGYSPANVRWATWAEQNRNKRQTIMLTLGDRTMCRSDWAALLGISARTLAERIDRGWPLEKALTTPAKSPHDPKIRYD